MPPADSSLARSGDGEGFVFVLLVAIPVVVLLTRWHFRQSVRMIDDWARAHGLHVLSREYRWLARGPFFWTTSKNQAVYRIAVRDAQGNVSTGWARCGGRMWGLLTDRVDVRWDDQPRREAPGFPVVMRDGRNDPPSQVR